MSRLKPDRSQYRSQFDWLASYGVLVSSDSPPDQAAEKRIRELIKELGEQQKDPLVLSFINLLADHSISRVSLQVKLEMIDSLLDIIENNRVKLEAAIGSMSKAQAGDISEAAE